jgi:abortive infection bacteriophage resistance protein
MRYEKPALSLIQQVEQWQQRGLVISDTARAQRYLSSIGYYRLSAYCQPFEQPSTEGLPRQHQFLQGTDFEQVLRLYIFDRKLRLLVMEAIERIEVAVRTGWAHAMALRHGPHAYMSASLFKNHWDHTRDLARIAGEMERSGETFVEHYLRTYEDPFLPPIWAVVETMSLGTLSRWVKNTRDNPAKQEVATSLGLPTVEVLEQVLHALTPVRNTCAHHGRLWNRRLAMTLPKIKRYRTSLVAPESPHYQAHHLYNYLTVLALMMNRLNPGSSWHARVAMLISAELEPHLLSAMGFPADWAQRPAWAKEPAQ